MSQYYSNYIKECGAALEKLEVWMEKDNSISGEEGIDQWVEITKKMKDADRTIYFVGNGASAMMAGHMSADATKNGGLKCLFLSETALLTAVSNDISYNDVFSFPLRRFASEGDMLIAISSSGNSENIIRAIEAAKEKRMKIVTLTGLNKENRARKLGDINLYVPGKTYGIVEVCHQALLHCWLDKYLDIYEGGRI